jgi:hypothetical protein
MIPKSPPAARPGFHSFSAVRLNLHLRHEAIMKSASSVGVIGAIVAVAALAGIGGCATQDTSSSVSARQDKALNDPMNYSPDMKNTDIMGGGVGTYDPNAMKRDLDDVFFIP